MKPSDVVKILDDLRTAIENCEKDDSMAYMLPSLTAALVQITPMYDHVLAEVAPATEIMRDRLLKLKGEDRVRFFDSWRWADPDIETYKKVFKSYVNWEYPCMEIFPGVGDCLPHVLGAEPLYIVDYDKELLEIVSQQFNEYYREKRLMKYAIKDLDLSDLPKDSFGFVYCVNWLRFENNQGLNNLAREVYGCLMPGGAYMFTFNPIDKPFGMRNAETGYATGADSRALIRDLTDIGYEIVTMDLNQGLSYIICKRPGDIEYIKAGSLLAQVIDKPEDL